MSNDQRSPDRNHEGLLGFMGVSLGSRAFSRAFLHWLPSLLRRLDVRQLHVIVFDHAEIINYRVLSGYDAHRAKLIAATRAVELKRMLRILAPLSADGIALSITASSDTDDLQPQVSIARAALYQLRAEDARVRSALIEQVVRCAPRRLAKFPEYARNSVALAASDYVIEEVAWSWAYFLAKRPAVEFYPGPNQPLKAAVLSGAIDQLEFLRLPRVPHFINCAPLFLSERGESSEQLAKSA